MSARDSFPKEFRSFSMSERTPAGGRYKNARLRRQVKSDLDTYNERTDKSPSSSLLWAGSSGEIQDSIHSRTSTLDHILDNLQIELDTPDSQKPEMFLIPLRQSSEELIKLPERKDDNVVGMPK